MRLDRRPPDCLERAAVGGFMVSPDGVVAAAEVVRTTTGRRHAQRPGQYRARRADTGRQILEAGATIETVITLAPRA